MKIIALTSCPVGMAHTYMSAAALKKYGKKMKHDVKVETQGAMGIRDRLTAEDIAEADLFILAADGGAQEVERFKDVPTYETSTSKVIRKTVKVINEAIASIK